MSARARLGSSVKESIAKRFPKTVPECQALAMSALMVIVEPHTVEQSNKIRKDLLALRDLISHMSTLITEKRVEEKKRVAIKKPIRSRAQAAKKMVKQAPRAKAPKKIIIEQKHEEKEEEEKDEESGSELGESGDEEAEIVRVEPPKVEKKKSKKEKKIEVKTPAKADSAVESSQSTQVPTSAPSIQIPPTPATPTPQVSAKEPTSGRTWGSVILGK